ncbi:protein ANTAGONIST OF LIKE HETEROCHROMATIN PROTEIN 1-like [Photinus pyralis]|uniref:protein ANTAGONIST OF LIKE HETEROCHROMATIN PROTEIN 1-like n=1 Tax=Photinus pyralis TaxID=7054 RepID=UPI0012672E08|nr:protein ANTAGONIST OF LIKE HETEROCHROMATIN PROTEIN 1-like [Photinus pyralis]
MDSEDEVIAAAAASCVLSSALILKMKNKSRRKRRWWALSLNKSRGSYSGTNMLQDLTNEPSGKFENFCRMSAVDFEHILNKIGPYITKKDTVMRKSIPPNERLAVTLRFLASGDSFVSLSYLFKMSNQVISDIVHEVCQAIIEVTKEEIQMPQTTEEWKKLSEEYYTTWNFPNCLGAIDGKHVVLVSPTNSGSEFINYKGTFSIVLMALVDANYCFTYADVGCQGRISDGGVFRNTTLFKKMEANELNFPLPEPICANQSSLPYVIVADDAFSLSEHLMKPYPGIHEKGSKERHFNYRLSRARRVVENAFGILALVFRVFRKPMLLQPDKASNIVMTCILLHNFLRKSKTSKSHYAPPGTFDRENNGQVFPGAWRQEDGNMSSLLPLRNIPRRSSRLPKEIRDSFAEYFATTGKLPWQDAYC